MKANTHAGAGGVLALLLVLPGLYWPAVARATYEFCVSDKTELQAALVAGEFAPGPVWIKLARNRTYYVDDTLLDGGDDSGDYEHDSSLTIEGGYDATCSGPPIVDAAATVLKLANGYYMQIFSSGNLAIKNLSVEGMEYVTFGIGGNDNLRLFLQNTRFVGNQCVLVEANESDDSLLRVENSLFTQAKGHLSCALNVHAAYSDGTDAVLVNDTVAGNPKGGMDLYGVENASIYNSIFYGNNLSGGGYHDLAPSDDMAPPTAIFNTIGSVDGSLSVVSYGNSSADPLFVGNGDFNLQPASPARDHGTSAVPYGLAAQDIEGGDRVVGPSVDQGAFESDYTTDTILTVTSTADSGAGTLRQAIDSANANPGYNIIGFNIPGTCPRTIQLASALPVITDAVAITGYSQPGASGNSSNLGNDNAKLCIFLNGNGSIQDGLKFSPADDDDGLQVNGLAIGGFYGSAISIAGGSDNRIWGNFIGLQPNGSTAAGLGRGVLLVGGQTTVGGQDRKDINVIGNATLEGIGIVGANTHDNVITNNHVGMTAGGSVAAPNGVGVVTLSSYGNYISDNVISGNNSHGVRISGSTATSNWLDGNRIGTKAFSVLTSPALGNGGAGVQIDDDASGTVIFDNTFAYNNGTGINLLEGDKNHFYANRIHDNGGLGIDLGGDGVDPIDNDTVTPINAPNARINAPEIVDARGAHTSGTATVDLQSANGDYVIEVYSSADCDPSLHGQGASPVGQANLHIANASIGHNGSNSVAVPISSGLLDGRQITAIASRKSSSFGYTSSEFSACAPYVYDDVIFADGFETTAP